MIENGGNDMALQFILGSARSGKTDFIYDQMIKDSMEHEDEEFFFIVPDQSGIDQAHRIFGRSNECKSGAADSRRSEASGAS